MTIREKLYLKKFASSQDPKNLTEAIELLKPELAKRIPNINRVNDQHLPELVGDIGRAGTLPFVGAGLGAASGLALGNEAASAKLFHRLQKHAPIKDMLKNNIKAKNVMSMLNPKLVNKFRFGGGLLGLLLGGLGGGSMANRMGNTIENKLNSGYYNR